MARGRKGQSTSMKLLRGNPGKRKLNFEEPIYPPGAPDKPAWLDKHSSGEWNRLVTVMMEGRTLTKADGGILLSCCLAFSEMVRNELVLQKLGDCYMLEDEYGRKLYKNRPEIIRAEVSRRQYVSFLAELGQTTVAKTKVKRIPETAATGVKRLLG